MDFSIMVIDDAGAEKTGGAASTTIKIKREADDFFFDFSDSTFKAIPTTLTFALGETEATRWAGGYNKEIDVSGFDDGEYDIKMKYNDGTFIRNFIETISLIGGVEFHSNKSGYSLSAAGIDAIYDEIIEGSLTARNITRIMLAEAAGTATGGGTPTAKYFSLDKSKARIIGHGLDELGNRPDVTLDGS